jgi:hypothetical protein
MNARRWAISLLSTAAIASASSAGCSHEVDSPPITVQGPVAPDLACVAQLTTPISLTGTGFTPMPSKALQGPEALILPSVKLTREQQLDGSPASDSPVLINGDPASGPDSAHVRWTSSTQMSFDVWPQLSSATGLPTGLYDINVINPDGKQSGSYPKSLGAVPPPSIKQLVPPAICDQESNQTIEIDGSNFLAVGNKGPTVTVGTQTFDATVVQSSCTAIPGTYTEGVVQECTSITFTIPQGTFQQGDYPVTVTNPAPANCVSSETLTLHDEPPPVVTKVAPGSICQGGGKLTIDGSNFIATPTVSLESSSNPTITSTSVQMNSAGTQLTALIPGGAVPNTTYDVVVTNPDGCSDVPPHQQVTVTPGPVIYLVEPNVVYDGANMLVTVFMTAPYSASDQVYIVPTGQSSPQTILTTQPVTGHTNRFSALVPKGQAQGVYDLVLQDPSGCMSAIDKAITVTSDLTITMKNVAPPFGATTSETDITIFRDTAAVAPGDYKFIATPTAFLYPHNATTSDVATQLLSVSYVDANTLTAVVPSSMAAKVYDLIVADPDGHVGFLQNAFTVSTLDPPVITSLVPSSIVDAANQKVTVDGTNFRTGATVSVTCKDSANASYTLPVQTGTVACTSSGCSVPTTIDGSSLSAATAPTVCIVRLTNTDGTYADYSALGVTNSSLNLEKPPVTGTNMTTARRALVSSAVDATAAARFIYAIGGDTGQSAQNAPLASTEFASVDLYGKMGTWTKQRYALPAGRSFAGATKLGRYTYVFGGTSDATSNAASTNSAIRAMTLSPRETPTVDVDDILLKPTGLDSGWWFYKVSAIFDTTDNDNPGGDSLPSDEQILDLPVFPGSKFQVKLAWDVPRDNQGVALPNVVGYKIYRTATVNGASGGEVLIATIGNVTTYLDDGTATIGTEVPLPIGSMGQWKALPNMSFVRKGPASAIAADPVTADRFYTYAMLGLDGTGAALKSYEFLRIDVATNGHQTFGTSWTTGASSVTNGRWQAGAWMADATVSSNITGATEYVYIGGGYNAASNGEVNDVDVGLVASGGDLGTLTGVLLTTNNSGAFNQGLEGYAVCAAVNQLFTLGGKSAGAISQGATSATISSSPPKLAVNAWNSEGITLTSHRYLLGGTVQSAFIFLMGGDSGGGTATASTEAIIW